MTLQDELKKFENSFKINPDDLVAGVDEAGRGPLAGPVVVAACLFLKPIEIPFLNDSKKLTEKKREIIFEQLIQEESCCYSIQVIDREEIDRLNIYQATLQGMQRAVLSLKVVPQLVLVDGMPLDVGIPSHKIIKGDARCFSIAAASVLAKVTRDKMMLVYDKEWPGYGFARHKGYGTAQHLKALASLGPSPLHRRSFSPIKEIFWEKTIESVIEKA